ncbi:hypothetical protein [Hanstruepera flava]|uniref:hypothetical protein n=1 Tax=Hanstruepera flava TaxID=2930218 RepID=UPI002027836B|nr:hypothetical protein [Hanstruepera flava]
MKKIRVIFLIAFMCMLTTYGQNTMSEQQIRRQAAKVDTVYTVEERANMGVWFNDRVNDMQLTADVREEYDAIIFSRIYDMTRINDKDKDYTDKEMQKKFDDIVDKMNMEVKKILTTEQYINHLENFAEIERSVYKKFNWAEK